MPQLHDHQQCEHKQRNGKADGQVPQRPASQSGTPNQYEPNKYRNPKQRARRHAKKELFLRKHVAYTTYGLDEEIGPTEGLAKPQDMDIHRSLFQNGMIAPDFV
jgi:hypothetical protein